MPFLASTFKSCKENLELGEGGLILDLAEK